jgi:membrane protein YqaA with SNARE-associated domain
VVDLATYGGLFVTALLAATILPLQSEAVLVGLLMSKSHPAWALLVVASVGNILGSALNWGLGRGFERFRERSWFPLKGDALARSQAWYQRYGKWSLLLSWVPIIGDPLTVAAGIMREPFAVFIGIVALAKIGRYLVVAATTATLI